MTEGPTQQSDGFSVKEREVDPALLAAAMEKFRGEQNLVGGIIAGLIAAVVGGSIWAAVTVATGFQIGWMAIGVGFLVGFAVRKVGKGQDNSFGIAGAVLAFFGCILGNFFTVIYFIGQSENMGFMEVLSLINPMLIPEILISTFSPMDLLFYGFAVYEGYKFSFRRITVEELDRAMKGGLGPT